MAGVAGFTNLGGAEGPGSGGNGLAPAGGSTLGPGGAPTQGGNTVGPGGTIETGGGFIGGDGPGGVTNQGGVLVELGGVVEIGGSAGTVIGLGGVSQSGGSSGSGNGGSSGSGGQVTGGSGGVDAGGSAGTGPAGNAGMEPGSYALPPPSQCHNQDYIDYQEGCIAGDTTTLCGGKCNVINACQESSAEKPYADVTFICPRFMLFSDEMMQAAIDDGNSDFNYAIVGHDVDRGGIDGTTESTCCQCYQLVYAYPSPNNERQVLLDPDHPNPPKSAIKLPKPLIVQSFNTAATPTTFDVYMAAGGFGANNACAPNQQPAARSGLYLYTDYPTDGQPGQGGVKPVSLYTECKNETQWVTQATLSSDACQQRVANACNQITSDIPGLTEQGRRSCLESNNPDSYYHMNWAVYAMKVECPAHLTEVTGCKLSSQGLPEVDRASTTAEQAALNPGFWTTSSSGQMYETTTMEDCCRPSCAAMDWVSGRGLPTDSLYNAFYSCDPEGVPITEPQ